MKSQRGVTAFHRRGGSTAGLVFSFIATAALLLASAYFLGAIFGSKSRQLGSGTAIEAGTTGSESRSTNDPPRELPPTERQLSRARVDDSPANPSPPIQPRPTRPSVALEPPVVDLGVLRPGEIHTASTFVRNVGSEPIRIERSRASCACTTVDMVNVVIPPGESVPLTATIDTSRNTGPLTTGVYLHFDGYEEMVTFTVRAEIALTVRAQPAHVVALGDVTSGRIILEGVDRRPFRILSIAGLQPEIVGHNAGDPPQHMYILDWNVGHWDAATCLRIGGETNERMPAHMVIATDHPDCRILDLQVQHECTRRQWAQGAQLWTMRDRRAFIGEISPDGVEYTADMLWRQRAVPNDTIISAISESPTFSAELIAFNRHGNDTDCIIRITPQAGHSGLIYGEVLLLSEGGFSDRISVIGAVK